jgi:hypothetical protein
MGDYYGSEALRYIKRQGNKGSIAWKAAKAETLYEIQTPPYQD